jgi:hypothetical protein
MLESNLFALNNSHVIDFAFKSVGFLASCPKIFM